VKIKRAHPQPVVRMGRSVKIKNDESYLDFGFMKYDN
jgi:hypothetical protein